MNKESGLLKFMGPVYPPVRCLYSERVHCGAGRPCVLVSNSARTGSRQHGKQITFKAWSVLKIYRGC